MANRFIETNYYKSPFVRSLKGSLKLLYSFIICDCTGAGIWPLDLEAASLYTGFEITFEEFDKYFIKRGKAVDLSNGKYFFPDFIEHQYPKGLKDTNPAHTNVILELKKIGLLDENNSVNVKKNKGAFKELPRDISNGNGKVMDMVEEVGKVKETKNEKFIVPEMQKIWKKEKPDYPDDMEKDFTALQSLSNFICDHSKIKYPIKNKEDIESVLKLWKTISVFIAGHNFFKNYSLYQVEKHIQNITQAIQNGESNSKNGKQAVGKVNGQQLNEAFTKFYSDAKSG